MTRNDFEIIARTISKISNSNARRTAADLFAVELAYINATPITPCNRWLGVTGISAPLHPASYVARETTGLIFKSDSANAAHDCSR
jgi:hypothetical protein